MRDVERFRNRPVREEVFLTALFEDHSKLRFPWSVIPPCKYVGILVSRNG